MLPIVLSAPPLLPLEVEFVTVAGGDGRPEEIGLSGGTGSSGSWFSMLKLPPIKIAESGRLLVWGRAVIGADRKATSRSLRRDTMCRDETKEEKLRLSRASKRQIVHY